MAELLLPVPVALRRESLTGAGSAGVASGVDNVGGVAVADGSVAAGVAPFFEAPFFEAALRRLRERFVEGSEGLAADLRRDRDFVGGALPLTADSGRVDSGMLVAMSEPTESELTESAFFPRRVLLGALSEGVAGLRRDRGFAVAPFSITALSTAG